MNLFNRYGIVLLSWLGILVMSAGCVSSDKTLFTISGPGWRVREGQALWRPGCGMPELGGDLIVARHERGNCLVQFSKTPLPLVSAQTTRTNWLIQFPPRRLGFCGRNAPYHRFTWLYLSKALAGEPLPAFLHFEQKPDGGWRLENLKHRETIEGFLSP